MLAASLISCGDASSDHGFDSGSPAPFELAEASVFTGRFGPHIGRPFDVIAADMDVDGDPDVLVNWHLFGAMELFENKQGRFELVNPLQSDESGLFDNPGIPSLYADAAEMSSRVEESPRAGLYVWQDLLDADGEHPNLMARRGSWRFLWKDDGRKYDSFVLDLLTSWKVVEVEGLEASEVEETRRSRRITFESMAERRAFRVKTTGASRFRLGLRTRSGEPIPLFVGRDLTPHPKGELDVWEIDPHGMAWVDVEGSARPELYITRGALVGKLVAPLAPKLDRYYRPGPPGGLLYEHTGDAVVPRDYGRGRRVEWVDIDNDGSLELSVANKETPNRLLVRDRGSGRFRDAAAELGVDLVGAEVQCWGDHDGDGFQDMYFVEGQAIHLLRNRGGRRFERVAGESLGLTLPPSDALSGGLFENAALRLADFDNDGHLDLWLLGVGARLTSHLFRRTGEGFTDVSSRVGLQSVRRTGFATLLDVDNDGFEDVVSSGLLRGENKDDPGTAAAMGHALLWRNRRGESFGMTRLPLAVVPREIHVATSLDADGDGRWDVAAVGEERYLLRNVSEPGNSYFDISLRDPVGEPIGAVVRVYYADGSVGTRRYGSASSSAFSQVLGPLHFGVPASVKVTQIAVRWPGEREDSVYEAPALQQPTTIERAR